MYKWLVWSLGIMILIGSCTKSSSSSNDNNATLSATNQTQVIESLLTLTSSSNVEIGTVLQSESKDFTVSLDYQGSDPITKPLIGGLNEFVNFKGGSYPGTGGDCGDPIQEPCTMVFTFNTNGQVRKHDYDVTISYENAGGFQEISIPVPGVGKFLYVVESFTDGDRVKRSLSNPFGVWTDGTKLLIVDRNRNRILGWNSFPVNPDQDPDFVLGSRVNNANGPSQATANTCSTPTDIDSDGTIIIAACFEQHRVLI